ncbi:MAG: porin [Sulfurimonas sp.]|jgi:hypothetical protein|nr:porin [Sulfurimonas sp.]
MNKKKNLMAVSLLALGSLLQANSIEIENAKVNFSGFIDAFYSYDLNRPDTSKRQDFLFNHNRHNEFNINLALAKVSVEHEKYRANLALQAGTYPEDNYGHEPDNYQHLHEANFGLSLNSENSLWLDVGVFSSHLGFESAISMDNYTLTRSLAAESSPYYLAGAKLTYIPSQEWELAAILSNGWQVIDKEDGNSMLSLGTQVIYTPNERTTLNWSTFIGSDEPDAQRRMRYFNNLFGEFVLDDSWSVIAGLDVGLLQKNKGSSSYDMWYIPSLLAKYTIDKEYALGMRAEFVHDSDGAVIAGNGHGAKTLGLSSNFDYMPQKNVALRAEARWLKDAHNAYNENESSTLFITGSLAVKF